MAEKHRFKKNREFKQRLDEQAENEEGDIRSFTFHHHKFDEFKKKEKRDDRSELRQGRDRDRRDNRRDDRRDGRRDDRRDGRRDDRGGKRFDRGQKSDRKYGTKNNRHYEDD